MSTLTLNASIEYADDNDVEESIDAADFEYTGTTDLVSKGSQSILTTETTIGLGGVTPLGYCMFVNRDPTNYIDIKTGASGTIIARLRPAGGFCLLMIGSGITAPVAIANTAACIMEKFVSAS